MMGTISIHTSVDDLTSTFQCSIENYEVADFDAAIAKEKTLQRRSTVIKLLERAKRYKQKGFKRL